MVEAAQQPVAQPVGQGQEIPVRLRGRFTPDEQLLSQEMRKKLWEGQIPLKIDLSLDDVFTLENPRSLYIMAPRENYLFFILMDVKSLFDEHAPQDLKDNYKDMWFSYNKKPLKWNLPIGAQFDTAVGLERKTDETPWCLTFHYKDNPTPNPLIQNARKTFHFNFMNALKESQALRMGDANEILQFLWSNDEKKMIEEGLFKHNYEAFWQHSGQLLFKHIGDLKRFAIRVLSNTHHTFVQLNRALPALPVDQDGNIIEEENSEAFKKWQDEASSITIGQVLSDSFPNLFIEELNDDDDGSTLQVAEPKMEVLTQGVPIDLNTQLYWMQMNLSYPDGFLYLSFHFKN